MENTDTRVAMLSIIIEEKDNVESLNKILSEYSGYILGRMGLPYREKGISMIAVAMDAPQDVISALAGRLGRLEGITAKAVFQKSF